MTFTTHPATVPLEQLLDALAYAYRPSGTRGEQAIGDVAARLNLLAVDLDDLAALREEEERRLAADPFESSDRYLATLRHYAELATVEQEAGA